jgi:hypothetical protein
MAEDIAPVDLDLLAPFPNAWDYVAYIDYLSAVREGSFRSALELCARIAERVDGGSPVAMIIRSVQVKS